MNTHGNPDEYYDENIDEEGHNILEVSDEKIWEIDRKWVMFILWIMRLFIFLGIKRWFLDVFTLLRFKMWWDY